MVKILEEGIKCQNCNEEIDIVAKSFSEQVSSKTFLKCVKEEDFSDMLITSETRLEISCPCMDTKLSEEDSEFIRGYFPYDIE